MIRNSSGHLPMIGIIRDGVFHLRNISNEPETPQIVTDKLLEVFSLAFTSLKYFCFDNHPHQNILASDLDLFLSNLHLEMNQMPLLCELMRGNRQICETYGSVIIKKIIDAIITHGRKASFLDPLIVIKSHLIS